MESAGKKRRVVHIAAPAAAGSPAAPATQGALQGIKIFLHASIPHLRGRLPIIKKRLADLGASVAASVADPALSVAVVEPGFIQNAAAAAPPPPSRGGGAGSGGGCSGGDSRPTGGGGVARAADDTAARLQQWARASTPPPGGPSTSGRQRPACPAVVSPDWLDQVLASGSFQPLHAFRVLLGGDPAPQAATRADGGSAVCPGGGAAAAARAALEPGPAGAPPHPDAPMARFADWMGSWSPELDRVATQVELVLRGRFHRTRSEALGNEPVVQMLRELHKIEEAVGGPRNEVGTAGAETGSVNHNALNYAHAAAAVRGCAFRLLPSHSEEFLQQRLPFLGAFTARLVHTLVATGTCDQLEAFRSDRPVTNSRGELRAGTDGGATRRRFVQLPGVGVQQAARWWRLGFRSYEELEAATEPGGRLDPRTATGELAMSKEALYCLRHRGDLLAPLPPADVAEMRDCVVAALTAVTGVAEGWVVVTAGGGRRSGQVHDADWLVSHPRVSTAGLVRPLCVELVARGRLVSSGEGFCRVQATSLEGYLERARADAALGRWANRHQRDRYPHIFGVFLTRVQAGARRRMDIILVPNHRWPWALLGWTGSKQWLRFLRTHAGSRGMFLNSHCLLRVALLPPALAADIAARGDAPPGTAAAAPSSPSCGAGGRHAARPRPGDLEACPTSPSGSGGGGGVDKAAAASANAGAGGASVAAAAAAEALGGSWPPARPSGSREGEGGERLEATVLVVPEECPPTDQHGHSHWPPGWAPSTAAASSAAAAAAAAHSLPATAAVAPSAEGEGAETSEEGQVDRQCALLASGLIAEPGKPRVLQGRGSGRPVVSERDILELFGLPYRTPAERDCP